MPIIASDGSSLGSPTPDGWKAEGPGAFAVVIQFEPDHPRAPGFIQTITGGKRRTTTGEIELLGFLTALETVRSMREALDTDPENAIMAPEDLFTVVLDSEYVLKSYTENLTQWEANQWRTNSFRAIKHQVHWQDVADLRAEIGDIITLVHQKGHTRRSTELSVDPFVAINDLADRAAGVASRSIRDTGFIPQPQPTIWAHNAANAPSRDTDIRKLTAVVERVLTLHGRDAAVQAFRQATHNTRINA